VPPNWRSSRSWQSSAILLALIRWTANNSPASKEAVTAALLVIGELAQAKRAIEDMLERRQAQLNVALSRRKQGFESPRERQ
jgi:hypothetical protein